MRPHQLALVVGGEVVRRRQQRHHPVEALHPQPDDLLLAAHAAVVGCEPPGALAHRQLVLHDPREVARGDPRRPLALSCAPRPSSRRLAPHRSIPTVCTVTSSGSSPPGPAPAPTRVGPTSVAACTVAAHVVDPDHGRPRQHGPGGGGHRTGQAVPRRPRARPPGPAARRPRKLLRLVPTSTGNALGHQLGQVAQQGQVVGRGLAEADARVDPDLVHPGPRAAVGPARRRKRRAPRPRRRRSGGRPAWCGASPACAWPPTPPRRRPPPATARPRCR